MTTPQDPDAPRAEVPPTAAQPTERLAYPAEPAHPAPRPTVEQPVPGHAEPDPGAPRPDPAAWPAAEQSTAHAAAPGAPVPPPRSRWRGAGATAGRVAKHRATLVVVALVLGGAIGAGVTALAMRDDRDSRPAVSDARDRGGEVRGGRGGDDRGGDRRGGGRDEDRGGDRGGDRGDGPGRGEGPGRG
ncbi:hypothetical protein [Actinokineospora terrae]|uniref:Uncharacterized protein n=1 Tax=Actinokineospora terrae TaxID=155974 RepID=A0A1H9TDK0_9PSEU|nr:hypothetical protein [Actinokineospora terrae]SER94693.1 hypothetical protein SAMN04487818_106186 [Actinokineospora terrae]